MQHALEKYDVNVIGLTLSGEQRQYAIDKLAKVDTNRNVEVRLQGWEEFTDKVDRIVSIGAFEHFGRDRWPAFFDITYNALPDDGRMLLHTITAISGQDEAQAKGIPMTMSLAKFTLFIMREIFPAGSFRRRGCRASTPPTPVSLLPATTKSGRTTHAPWRTGRRCWRPTRSGRSRCRARRPTTASTSTSTAAWRCSATETPASTSTPCRNSRIGLPRGLATFHINRFTLDPLSCNS